MPLPDNWNERAFKAALGSRMSEEEEALEGFKAKALLAIKNAFEQYPLNTTEHALARWVIIRKEGMVKAYECFDILMGFSLEEEKTMLNELNYIREANNDFDIDAVIQGAESYIAVIEKRLEREGL